MIGGMTRRMSSSVFVGRSKELQGLLSMADVAASGTASVALIGGEAGVGKSRLVAEVAARVRDRAWLVLEGGSVALGDADCRSSPSSRPCVTSRVRSTLNGSRRLRVPASWTSLGWSRSSQSVSTPRPRRR